MAYCQRTIARRAVQYYRNAASVNKYESGHEYLKTLWCYSTKLHPLDPSYRELDKSQAPIPVDKRPKSSSEILEKNIAKLTAQMIEECFDEYIVENPKMQRMNTLRIHPAMAEFTIGVPANFDDELFSGIRKYCDDLGIRIKKTDESIETLDSKGIPLYLWTDENSAKTGIIHCRSRDTGYSYQAHILRMKKLIYTFASDYGPFQPYDNMHAWTDFQEDVKSMPAMISQTEAFGTPVYKVALNHKNKEIERMKYTQMSTTYEDIIQKVEEKVEEGDGEMVDIEESNVDHSQFY
jgi:hypothetical protein